jgi:hypothetical protein
LCLTAELLKIDFNYKLAAKIRVWSKQGKSFAPFKCIITIQNQDGLTIFWKALKHSESFREIKPDLIRLNNRLKRNGLAKRQAKYIDDLRLADAEGRIMTFRDEEPFDLEEVVKCIYVDNCCGVSRTLEEIFPGAIGIIKLDAFHWLKRWNECLNDPLSAQAGIFRALMSRALFNVEPTEYEEAAKRFQEKRKRQPNVPEILKEANSIIPSAVILKSNMEAVLSYIHAKDAETDRKVLARDAEDTSPCPKRFFKRNIILVRDAIRKQMRHVNLGCLSDPDPSVVNIFRHNPVKKVTFVARGTNTNERDNLDLASLILSATHIGINRAERLMWSFFEFKNQRKCILRLGEEDHGTVDLEKLLMLNSYAKSLGFEKLPYESIKAPVVPSQVVEEYMGFCSTGIEVQDVSNPTDTRNTAQFETVVDDEVAIAEADNEEDVGDVEFEEFLADIYGIEEVDIEQPVGEADFPETTAAGTSDVERH